MKDLATYLSMNMNDPMKKNHVLVVIKPGFERLLGKLCDMLKSHGYSIVKTKTTTLTLSQAQQLYKVHSKEDFYDDLCKYMSSDPTTAFILKKKSDNIFKDFESLKNFQEVDKIEYKNIAIASDSIEGVKMGIVLLNMNTTFSMEQS